MRVVKPGSTTEYAYDSIDRRTVVIQDGVMTRTLWSGSDEVGEYDLAGVLKRRYIPDGSGAMDARLATVNPDNTIHWHHTDHQGSVIATSNAAGQGTGFTNYSPHGEFGTAADGAALSVPPIGSPFGYTGRQWDAGAGLYQYRARYYSPELGIFLSTDPIGTKDDPNLYMYVGADPVNHTDPTGMTCEKNEDGKGVTCKIDEPGDLDEEEVDRANRVYTRAVNRLLVDPNRTVRLQAVDGNGNTITRTTTAGEIADGLINATVIYRPDAGVDSNGNPQKWNAATNLSGTVIYIYDRGLAKSDRRLALTFIHEGGHTTRANRELRRAYETRGGALGIVGRRVRLSDNTPFNVAHQDSFSAMATQLFDIRVP